MARSATWGGLMILIPVALLLLLILCLAGCSRDREEAPAAHRLVVALPQWFYPSEESPWQVRVWESIRKENPGARFDLQLIPGRTEQVLQKLLVSHASGEGPDLACVKMHWAGVLVRRGILKPLEGLVPGSLWEDLVPAARAYAEPGGKPYLLPYDLGVRVILYRADLFRQAGLAAPSASWTWEDLLGAARKLTVDKDGDGRVDQWGFGVPGSRSEKTIFQWLPWFWSLGGRVPDAGEENPSLRSPAAIQALQWYRDLAGRYRVVPPSFYSLDQESIFQGLAGGLFAMTEGGSWETPLLAERSLYGSEIRMALLPDPRPGLAGVTLADGWGFVALSRDSRKDEVLRRVLAALSSPEHQLAKYENSQSLPPFGSLYRDPRFLKGRGQADVLAEAVSRSRALPEGDLFAVFSEAVEAALQEILIKGKSPEEALAAREKKYREQLRTRARSGQGAGGDGPEPALLEDPAGGGGEPGTGGSAPEESAPAPGPAGRPGEIGAGQPSRDPPGSLLVRVEGEEERPLGRREGDAGGSPTSSVPPGSLLVRVEGEEERLLGPEDLGRLGREKVGDLALVPLAALAPSPGPREILLRAADGFEKRVPGSEAAAAFLDPETMRAFLLRERGKTFTVRDLAEVSFLSEPGTSRLVVVSRGRPWGFDDKTLRSLADEETLSFRRLLEARGIAADPGAEVRLVAGDGYQRDVPLERFLQGRLHLTGMRCEFPSAPSKDQVAGLVRVEIP